MTKAASSLPTGSAGCTVWLNDDLLIDSAGRHHFAETYPAALPIFDWPELRAQIASHEPDAAQARKAFRYLLFVAVGLGCLAGLVSALVPLTDLVRRVETGSAGPELRLLGGAIAGLTFASLAFGHLLRHRRCRQLRWLACRYAVERLRQLHFQLIVNNLAAAAEAMRAPAALEQWRALRARMLCNLTARITPPTLALAELHRDIENADPWLDAGWRAAAAPPPPSPELAELLALLRHFRIDFQLRYLDFKNRPGPYSPRSKERVLGAALRVLNGLAAPLTILAGILVAMGYPLASPVVIASLVIGGVLGALATSLRDLGQGLGFKEDADRNEDIHQAMRSLARRYDESDEPERPFILRDMERLSYDEMRAYFRQFDIQGAVQL